MTIRLILADDHRLTREGLISLIAREPDLCVVAQAENGREAIELARLHKPDMIIMDLSMPELNGLDATKQILAERPDCKILALSLFANEPYVRSFFAAGGQAYLTKMTAFEEVVAGVRAVWRGERFLGSGLPKELLGDLPQQGDKGPLNTQEIALMTELAAGRLPEPKTRRLTDDMGEGGESDFDFAALKTAGFSGKEIEVLSFLPLGYTNTQIGNALGVKEVTVKKHLRRAGERLGAQGKTEILYRALQLKREILKKASS